MISVIEMSGADHLRHHLPLILGLNSRTVCSNGAVSKLGKIHGYCFRKKHFKIMDTTNKKGPTLSRKAFLKIWRARQDLNL